MLSWTFKLEELSLLFPRYNYLEYFRITNKNNNTKIIITIFVIHGTKVLDELRLFVLGYSKLKCTLNLNYQEISKDFDENINNGYEVGIKKLYY